MNHHTTDTLRSVLSTAGTDNLATGLEFLISSAIKDKDPAKLYLDTNPALVRTLATARGSEARAAIASLKTFFGKDFSVSRLQADVKEIKAELSLVSQNELSGRLITNDSGVAKPLLANAITYLTDKLPGLTFDSFASKILNQTPSPWHSQGPWRDSDDSEATNYLQHAGITIQSAVAHEAAATVANRRSFHPVRDWLSSLVWDGDYRACQLARYYFGATGDDKYLSDISEAWLTSAVARIMRPGCMAKYMIVLEGEQDQAKSKALRALVNGHLDGDKGVQWFADRMPAINHDDLGLYMQGVWVIEIAELGAIRGKQWEDVKAFLSSPTDRFRRKFGRNMQDYPRQCVFAGTTNEYQWGGDQTGLVRFWPMKVGVLNVEHILRDRDQIWAEAVHLFNTGHDWHLNPAQEPAARAAQEERMPDDIWIERVEKAAVEITIVASDFSMLEMMQKLGLVDKGHSMQVHVARALLKLRYYSYRPGKGGSRTRRYRKVEIGE